jgi:pimeloyl-ACP methyl ester carboxylesterase
MQEKQILIDKLRINYKIAGQGPAILILHGWGGSSDSWVEVQQILAEKEYKVIAPDFSGFGKSITPPAPWGIKEYVEVILKFTEKLGLDKFILVGHSFGGRIAIRFTHEHPEKVEKLILCNSAGIKPNPGIKTTIVFILARIGNAILSPKYLVRLKDLTRNIFYSFLRKKDYVKANKMMREIMKKVLNEDLSADLVDIKNRTLIIWGEKDKMVPVKYAYVFKEKISNSKLEIIPKIGHSPHLEGPEKLAVRILSFIREK